ncbi:metallopeptidase family protein [Arthrobacter russicus]|jgi:predicted Zn-dependent protease with MMP-like domain|uniref:Zn-dependent protease with MMP-like domain n=1 Tax=Arthrobacter russicus TaxID=172040 RepID=A0ABU1JDP8_9MICC|nr:metallopeptidase family protein [Arthrobacter russicus]MBQ1443408.1 metallopeptidase family protein [Renibacterium sp.]MDN5668833.1 metallopeptidase family protein [Renibacterium salmoninarum]MDR6269522.1 putative Zn-dependent protease with MMP-like domain [Arthrobacter russicus]
MTDPLASMPRFGRYEMSLADFESAVDDAVAQIPPDLAASIENVAIVVEERYLPEPGEDPDTVLLGLYQGVPLTERTEWSDAGSLPDKISIYRQAILDICNNREEVVEEVLVTVVHEIAHFFGIDDAKLHDLGWG